LKTVNDHREGIHTSFKVQLSLSPQVVQWTEDEEETVTKWAIKELEIFVS